MEPATFLQCGLCSQKLSDSNVTTHSCCLGWDRLYIEDEGIFYPIDDENNILTPEALSTYNPQIVDDNKENIEERGQTTNIEINANIDNDIEKPDERAKTPKLAKKKVVNGEENSEECRLTKKIQTIPNVGTDVQNENADEDDICSVDEMLINAVAKYSVLYDYKQAGNSRKFVEKTEAWNNVVKDLRGEINLIDAKKRWKTLRDRYIRIRAEINKNKFRSGAAAPPKRAPWVYYKSLSFLDDSLHTPPTVSNVINGGSSSDILDDDESHSGRSTQKSRSSRVTERRQLRSTLNELVSSLKNTPPPPPTPQRPTGPAPHELTEIDGFGIMIVNKLKKLPDNLVPDVMMDIMTRMHTAERMARSLSPASRFD